MGKDATLNTTGAEHRELRRRAAQRVLSDACRAALVLLLLSLGSGVGVARGEVEAPLADIQAPIRISAAQSSRWREGEYDVWLLSGGCRIQQGQIDARAEEAVLWVTRGDPLAKIPSKIIAYLETDVLIDFQHQRPPHKRTGRRADTVQDTRWLGRFHTLSQVHFDVQEEPTEAAAPAFFQRGVAALQAEWTAESVGQVEPTQLLQPTLTQPMLAQPILSPPVTATPLARSVQILPRSSVPPQLQSIPSAKPGETIVAVTSGVRIVIEGIQNVPGLLSDKVTIEADRVVVWTTALSNLGAAGQLPATSVPGRWEFYVEGNIVYVEGDRVIYADQMYYNANDQVGVIRNAEALTPAPDYEGLLRLKADVLQQLNRQNFVAYGAAITSSRLGVPRYWLQSETITFQDNQIPQVDPLTGAPVLDPQTGGTAVSHELLATSRNNFVYLGGVPLLYWPYLATDLTEPTFYVDGIQFRNDNVFGSQAFVDWNAYQLFGIREPIQGTEWTFSTDYLSLRGPAAGTYFSYTRNDFLFIPGPVRGFLDAWGVLDHGVDNLGRDRRDLIPETDTRGRVLFDHRQELPYDFEFTAEFGIISDRNFLEEYYEYEWDEFKDESTSIALKRYVENSSWQLWSSVRLNDFFTTTEWLPRADHILLGESFLYDRVTWYGHSHAAYANLRVAEPPSPKNPSEVAKFDPLAWEADREGIHVGTRQELDLPLQLGVFKLVPFVSGELFRVGEDMAGEQLTRALGQAGARASLPLAGYYPEARSTLFNLNGLAHKIVVDAEYFYADADRNLDEFPLYEPLDDDAQEAYRRRFYFDTFMGMPGGNVPLQFDERYFAFRSGMQRWVTAASTEIADDLTVVRGGIRQRLQTRRGLPGRMRIVDWMELDLDASYFPKAERDNFGESLGMASYDYRWHLGDRLTLMSDGFADLFDDGLRTAAIGALITRPEVGDAYLGFRSIEGPISSNIINARLSYRMSEKWIFTGGTSWDLGDTGAIGQSLAFTRVGESFLLKLGFYVDSGRDNVGASISIEPRFLPSNRLGRVAGVTIPPAGALGLE